MPLSRIPLPRMAVAAALLAFTVTVSHAQNSNVPEGYESFAAYEVAMFERIDELAMQRGANIAAIHKMRDRLRAEYSGAERRNDRAGMAEAQALQAHLIRLFLERLSQ